MTWLERAVAAMIDPPSWVSWMLVVVLLLLTAAMVGDVLGWAVHGFATR